MTDKDVVERVAGLWNRKCSCPSRRTASGKKVYVTGIVGRDARELMLALRPLMGQRRGARIDSVLAEYVASQPNVGTE